MEDSYTLEDALLRWEETWEFFAPRSVKDVYNRGIVLIHAFYDKGIPYTGNVELPRSFSFQELERFLKHPEDLMKEYGISLEPKPKAPEPLPPKAEAQDHQSWGTW